MDCEIDHHSEDAGGPGSSAKYFSASSAAMHPVAAAVMACRHSLSCTSPACVRVRVN
jgi:hypothetical protein